MKLLHIFIVAALIGWPAAGNAGPSTNYTLDTGQVLQLARRCAPRVHPDTILAIVRQESALHPYALSINYPKTEAAHQGYGNARYELARQPNDRREALAWTRWFITHHHSVSIGLMQVSSLEARRLGISDLRALYEPCVNIAAGAVILQESYRGRAATLDGLKEAFALYNAGSIDLGTRDGYAAGVVAKAPPLISRPTPNPSGSEDRHTRIP